jgi:2-keto-4-pentenoate hydratase
MTDPVGVALLSSWSPDATDQSLALGWIETGDLTPPDVPCSVAELGRPQAAPGIVFQLAADLPEGRPTATDVLAATRGVAAGIQLFDADTDASTAPACRLVVGKRFIDPSSVDLTLLGVLWEESRTLVSTATGAAAYGHPARGVALLAWAAAERDRPLRKGMLVFSGPLLPPRDVRSGTHLQATFGHVGSLALPVTA